MPEKETVSASPAPAEGTAPSAEQYIKEIQELKAGSVPKAQYDALKKENGQLVHALAEGRTLPAEGPKEPAKTSRDYAKEMQKPGLSNLDYVTLSLKQRDKALEEGLPDPYMPQGKNFSESRQDDAENAEKAASFLRSCVEDADGDPTAFTAILQSRLRDDPQVSIAIAARKAAESKAKKGR